MSHVATLLDRASADTGLDDFGDDSFREGLEILVKAIDTEARLTGQGAAIFDAQLVDLLSRRLEVEQWYALHPEIDEQEIVRPLIGLGLPRTGSTALACLLGEDPAVRSIRNWETMRPCPPPETATEHSDPRIAETERRGIMQEQFMPRLKAMVPTSPTSPSECQNYMGYDFKSHLFQAWAQVPSYSQWLHGAADLEPTYRYVKRVLKLLQWRCPPDRWRLKNPAHMIFIADLDKVFPDARFWMTHRDIASVIPSVCDLYSELTKTISRDVDKPYLARLSEDCWEVGLHRLIKFRDAGNEDRFFDIHFAPFQHDPIAEIKALYAFLGEPFTDEARQRMIAWRQNTPRDKHGLHEYDPAEFGIDLDELRQRFRFYTDRFGIRTV